MRLTLRRFGVAYDATVIHGELSGQFDAGPVHLLYGASGSGKSTLLKALAGWQKRLPSMRVWGTAMLDERPLGHARVVLVQQALGFFVSTVGQTLGALVPDRARLTQPEQRQWIETHLLRFGSEHILQEWYRPASQLDFATRRELSLCVALLGDPDVLLLDEFTSGLAEAEAARLRAILQEVAREHIVLMATHDQQDQSRYRPCTVATLPIRLPEFDLPAIDMGDRGKSPPVAPLAIRRRYPTGFHWVLEHRLIAVARPGLLADAAEDLVLLYQHGTRHLLCLEESVPYCADLLPAGMRLWHFPIADMGVPASVDQTHRWLDRVLASGALREETVAVHCKAGLGRTGLICACLLVLQQGYSAAAAMLHLRQLDPRFVQTEGQAVFVEAFDNALHARSG